MNSVVKKIILKSIKISFIFFVLVIIFFTHTNFAEATAQYSCSALNTPGTPGTWDVGTTVKWSTAANCSVTLTTFTAGDSATFQGTGGTVTVSGTVSNAGITFSSTGWTISGGTALSPSIAAYPIALASGVSATISTPILPGSSTSIALTSAATGTLTLSGANTFTGTVNVGSGLILKIGANSIVNTSSPTGTTGVVTVTSGGTLDFNGFAYYTSHTQAMTINGTGATGTAGALVNSGATPTSAEVTPITMGSAATIGDSGSGNLTLSGAVSGSGNLTLKSNSTGIITLSNASINMAGTFTNSGSGSATNVISGNFLTSVTSVNQSSSTSALTLSGASTYTGATNVTLGTLKLGVSSSSAANGPTGTTGGGIIVSSGGTLDLNGFSYTSSDTEPLTINGTGNGAIGAITNSTTTATSYIGAVTVATASTMISSGTGGITLNGAITLTATLTVDGSYATSLTTGTISGAGGITKQGTGNLTLSGTTTLGGALTVSAGTVTAGISFQAVSVSVAASGTLALASYTLSLTGTGSVFTEAGAFSGATSTIKLTDSSSSAKTFSGGSLTYNNFWFAPGAGTGSLTIVGSNHFADFKDDGTAGHSILFTTASTQYFTTFTVSGANSSNLIVINSTSAGTHTLSQPSGTVNSNYLNIQYSIATGGATWNATSSTNNNGAGSGWNFLAPTCTSQVTTGNWNTAGTWNCGHVPATGDNVTIASGNTITMDVNSNVQGNLIINGTLNTLAGTVAIGNSYGGGIVYYILQSGDPGYVAGQTNGLIVTTADQSSNTYWHASNSGTTGTSGQTAIGLGNANTNAIVALYGAETNSARLCYDLNQGGQTDWYLPSTNELSQLYLNKVAAGISNFSVSAYWASVEVTSANGVRVDMSDGNIASNSKSVTTYGTRCIRSFSITPSSTINVSSATISGGTLTANASTINLTGTSGTLFTKSSGTFTSGTSTVNMTGNGNATVASGTPSFYNLTSSGTGTKSLGEALTATNILTISGGTLDTTSGGYYTVNANNIVVNGGTFTSQSSTINLTGTSGTLFTKSSGTFTSGTSTVNMTGNGNATVASGTPSFYNLTSSGTGTKSLGEDLTVTGAFNVSAGTVVVSDSGGSSVAIGNSYGGGIVYYILQSGDPGYVAGQTNGLIATTSDQSINTYWHVSNTGTTGASGTVIGTGNANTNAIVALYGAETNAASLCYNLNQGGQTDWYLPSVNEMGPLFTNRASVGSGTFNASGYWTSTEYSSSNAQRVDWSNGSVSNNNKTTNYYGTRCVRSFSISSSSARKINAGSINIGGGTLTANASTINLTGTSGTLFTNTGTFTPGTSTINLTGSGSVTINAGAYTFNNLNLLGSVNATLGANLTLGGVVNIGSGTTLGGGSYTLTIGGTGAVLTNAGTFVAGTSTIKINDTTNTPVYFDGGGQTYGNIWFSRGSSTGAITVMGGNTFNDFKDDGTAGHSLLFDTTPSLSIGNSYGGGKVAYILQSGDPGYEAGKVKGIIAADINQVMGEVSWWNGSYTTTGGTGTALGTGRADTDAAVDSQGTPLSYPAGLARAYNGGGYNDWYLPSQDELNKLCLSKSVLGFQNEGLGQDYWTSTEYSNTGADTQYFGDCGQVNLDKSTVGGQVRAVRSFKFTAGGTTTVSTWHVSGTANNLIKLDSTATTTWKSGLKSWWKFDGDSSDTNGIDNATVSGATLTTSGCHYGSCYTFNGSSNQIIAPSVDLSSTDEVSVAFWFKTTATGTDVLLEDSPDYNSYNGFLVDIGNAGSGYISLSDDNGGYNVSYTSNTYNDGSWHFFVGTINRNPYSEDGGVTWNYGYQNNIYIDGVSDTVLDTSHAETVVGNFLNLDLNMGARESNTLNFAGSLDEVMVWNRALSSTEAAALYSFSTSNFGAHTLSQASGTINADYLNIQHSIATGGAVWNAGSNSVNNNSVSPAGSGWTFPLPTCTSQTTGNWNTAGSWSCGYVPGAGNPTVIRAGDTITMNVNSNVLSDITVNGILTTSGTSYSLSGTTLTISTTGTLTANNSTITLSGTSGILLTRTGSGTFTAGGSTVVLSGNGSATVNSGTITLNNLTSSGTGTKTLGGDVTVGGNLVVSAGTFQPSTNSLTVTGTTSITGTLDDSSSTGTNLFTGGVTINNTGIWSSTGNSAYEFRGGLTVNTTSTFTSGSGLYTFSTNAQAINGNQIITISNLSNTITGSTGLTLSGSTATIGTLTQGTNAILTISGTVPTITTLNASTNANTVNYTGTGQTLNVTTYNNLTLSGGAETFGAIPSITGNLTLSGTASATNTTSAVVSGNLSLTGTSSFTTGATLAISTNLSIGNGTTFTMGGYATTISGTTTVGGGTSGSLVFSSPTANKVFLGLVTIASGATWNNSNNSTAEFRGGITNNGTFTAGTGTQTFNTNAQVLTGTFSIPNITTTISLSNTNSLTVSGGLEGAGALVNLATGTLSLGGTSGITTLTATASGNTVTYTGSGQTIKATTYDTLSVTGTASNTGTTTVNTALSGAGTLTNAASGTLNIGGTSGITGLTASANPNTVSYTGSGQTIKAATYDTLSVTNTASNTGTITVNTTLSGAGTFTNTATGTLNIAGTISVTNFTSTASGNTVNYSATAGGQTVKSTTYSNLTLSNSSNSDTAGGALTVNGNLITTSGGTLAMSTYQLLGTLNATNNGTITTSSTANPAITSGDTWTGTTGAVIFALTTGGQYVPAGTYKTLTFSNTSGTDTAAGILTVNGTITTTTGSGLLDMTSYQLAGTLTAVNNGTISTSSTANPAITTGDTWTGTTGVVTFALSTGAQYIPAGTYGTLNVNNTSNTDTAGGAITATTLNTSASGTLNMVTYDLGVTNITNNGIIRTQSLSATPLTTGKTWGGTVTYDAGTGAQTIMAGTYGILNVSNTSATDTASGAITTTTLTTSSGGTLNMVANALGVTNITNGGIIRTQNTSGAPLTTGKTWTGTVTYDAATGGQTIASGTYSNLTLGNTSGTQTLGGAITLASSSTLSIAGGTFDPLAYQITGSGTNTLSVASGATIRVGASTFALNYSSGFTTKTLTSGSTVDYNANGAQTIDQTLSYSNLNTSVGGTKTLGGSFTVPGVMTIGSGSTLALSSYTLTLSGTTGTPFVATGTLQGNTGTVAFTGNYASGNTTIPAAAYNSITVNNTAETFVLGGNTTASATGILTITDGTFDTSSTGNYSLSIGQISIASLATAILNANNSTITLTSTGGSVLLSKGASGAFNAGGGTVVVNPDAAVTSIINNTVTFNNLTLSPTLTADRSYSIGNSVTINGNFLINPSGSSNRLTLTETSSTTIGATKTLTVEGSGSATSTFSTNNQTLSTGFLDIESGGTFSAGSSTVTLTGITGNMMTIGGTGVFTAGTSTVNVNSSGSNIINSGNFTGTNKLYALTALNVSGYTKTLGGNLEFDPSQTLTITAGTLDTGASNYSLTAGSINIASAAAAILNIRASTFYLNGTSGTLLTKGASGTFTAGTSSTVNLSGNGSATVNSGSPTFYNLTSSGTGTKTLGAAITLASNGTLSVTTGTFDPAANLITANGTNTLSVASGGTLRVGASTFAGNYPAGFTTKTLSSGSTVEYSLAGSQTIDNTLTYSNLSTSTSGTKSLGGITTATGAVTIGGTSTLDTTSASHFTLNTGSIVMNGGTFLPQASTINLTGTGTVFSYVSGTITPATSLIKITDTSSSSKTFAGGNQTFNNLLITGAGTGTYTISGSNTFNDFSVDTPPHTINFTTGTTTTVSTFTVSGTAGNLITLQSSTSGAPWTLYDTAGTNTSNYLAISDGIVSGGAIYQALNSQDLGRNLGWVFGLQLDKGRGQSGGGTNGGIDTNATPDAGRTGGGTGGGGGDVVLPQCSDGIDNNADTLIDCADPNCHLGGVLGNACVPTWDSESVPPANNTGGGEGGGGGDLGYILKSIYSFINLPTISIPRLLLGMAFNSLYN